MDKPDKPQSKKKGINPPCGPGNGFIFKLVCWIFYLLNGLNIMEGVKLFAGRLANRKVPGDRKTYIRYTNIGVDIYTVVKWLVMLI